MSLTPDQVYLAKFLLSKNHSPEVVAGMLGNVAIETGDGANPNAFNPRENAKGIVQWTPAGGRQAAVDEYMRTLEGVEPWSLPAQAHALQWELDNREKNAALALSGATTPAEAASIFDAKYERSSGEHRDRRVAAANDIYKAMGEMDLANVDLAKLAITQNQPWPTNPMANDAMSANPGSGPTSFSLNSIMSPREDEKSSFHPTLGLQGLGAAIAAGSMGESAADDLTALRKQYFGERETEAERQRQEQQRAAMGPVFEKHPDLFAAWQAGAPVEQLIGIAAAREQMQHQSGENMLDRTHKSTENELDRGLSREELAEESRLRELGFDIDRQELAERVRANDTQVDQWTKEFEYGAMQDERTHNFDREKFNAQQEQLKLENRQWAEQFGLETAKYNEASSIGASQGVAARDFMANTIERLGDKETAKFVREMPASAFSDPSAVNQFKDIMLTPYQDGKDGRTAAAKNYAEYIKIRDTEGPEAAEKFHNLFVKPSGKGSGSSLLDVEKYKTGAAALKDRQAALPKLRQQRAAVEQMARIISRGDVMTGPINELLLPVKQSLVELGVVDPETNEWIGNVASSEQFAAMAKQIFPSFRVEGSGTTSDFDAKALEASFAGLGKTKEGNEAVLNAFEALGSREEAYTLAMDDWLAKNGNLDGFERDFSNRVKAGDPSVGKPIAFTEEQFKASPEAKANFAKHIADGNFGINSKFYLDTPNGPELFVIENAEDLELVKKRLGIK